MMQSDFEWEIRKLDRRVNEINDKVAAIIAENEIEEIFEKLYEIENRVSSLERAYDSN